MAKKTTKIDLHNHTVYSLDALTTPEELVRQAVKKGISSIALTDHDTMKALPYVEKAAKGKVIIIPGEEIMCREGEVIGLFLLEEIKPGLSVEEALVEIRGQGALAYAPHPFDKMRHGIKNEELLKKMDIIEVGNAKCTAAFDKEAERFADKYGLLKGAGSDSHRPKEVGRAYVEVENPVESPEELLVELKKGHIVVERRTTLLEKLSRHATLSWKKISEKFRKQQE